MRTADWQLSQLIYMGVRAQTIVQGIEATEIVPGRCEIIDEDQPFGCVVRRPLALQTPMRRRLTTPPISCFCNLVGPGTLLVHVPDIMLTSCYHGGCLHCFLYVL
jgi:hypothetical protein